MNFIKMQGLGNDFIVIDGFTEPAVGDPAALARRLCPRGRSVGADGLVLLLPSRCGDARMRIFNPDGSEPEMCGNAARCAAKYLYESGRIHEPRLCLETGGGIRHISMKVDGVKMLSASVDMGAPEALGDVELPVGEKSALFHRVSTGNPHAVTWEVWPEEEIFRTAGPALEKHPVFPEGSNIEFCRVLSRSRLQVRVWERGAGPTLACGTGATAAFFACFRAGLTDAEAAVLLPGGELEFAWKPDGHVVMTGPAEEIYRAVTEI